MRLVENLRQYKKSGQRLDASVVISTLNQLWRLLAGPVISIYCIPVYLTAADQGLWFSMISLSALTTFADLGFTNIIMQFSAHEFSRLSLGPGLKLLGPDEDKSRLGGLFRFSIRWIGVATFLLIPIIALAGFFVFPGGERRIVWLYPWLIYILSSAIGLVLNLVLSFLEGCNEIARIQGIKASGAVVNSCLLFVLLISHAGLYALAIASLVSNLTMAVLTVARYKPFFANRCMSVRGTVDKSWAGNVLRLLWRYAISWASGYFILQLYVPIMMKTRGEVAAGKVGLSWSLFSAAFSLSNVWIYTVIPRINMHIERKEWKALDSLVIRRFLLSLLTFIVGIAAFLTFLALWGNVFGIATRVIALPGLCILALGWGFQLFVNTAATYLRGFKEEPFMWPSIVGAVWILATSLLSARYLPIDYYYLSFLTSFIIGCPWSIYLLRKKRAMLKESI